MFIHYSMFRCYSACGLVRDFTGF